MALTSAAIETMKAEKFSMKKVYTGYLYKYHYNPVITGLHDLKYVLEELNININESDLNYNLYNKFLKICKAWFATVHPNKIFYRDFLKKVQMKMKELINNDFKDDSDNKKIKPMCKKSLKADLEEAMKNEKGRFVLTVDCKMSQVGSFKIDYSDLPNITTFLDKSQIWNHPPLTIRSLINWPYVGFMLHLQHVSIAHYTTHSYHRYIRLAGCEEELNIQKDNCMDLTQGFDNRIGLQCRVETLITYLCLCKQAADSLQEIPERRKEEFSIIIETIIRALSHCKSKSCSVNLECTYASSKYKFIREIDITDGVEIPGNLKKKSKTSSKSSKPDKLIEVMTPTFKFNISRCLFKFGTPKTERDAIAEYFKDILERRDQEKVNSFIAKMYKDVSYLCGYCNAIYNDNSFYKMEEHIQLMHGAEEPWSCLGCNVKFDAYQMTMYNWRHECK